MILGLCVASSALACGNFPSTSRLRRMTKAVDTFVAAAHLSQYHFVDLRDTIDRLFGLLAHEAPRIGRIYDIMECPPSAKVSRLAKGTHHVTWRAALRHLKAASYPHARLALWHPSEGGNLSVVLRAHRGVIRARLGSVPLGVTGGVLTLFERTEAQEAAPGRRRTPKQCAARPNNRTHKRPSFAGA